MASVIICLIKNSLPEVSHAPTPLISGILNAIASTKIKFLKHNDTADYYSIWQDNQSLAKCQSFSCHARHYITAIRKDM